MRRRTCPGTDGRKQRFNRYSSRRLNGEGSDDSSDESSVTEEISGQPSLNKHHMDSIPTSVLSKRPRRLSNDSEPMNPFEDLTVDTSLVAEEVFPAENEGANVFSLPTDQLTVSEVSGRLEEYARKARVQSGSKVGRRSGVVTPPFDGSSTGLVTYDDERNYDSDDNQLGDDIPPLRLSLATVSDERGEDAESETSEVTPPKTKQPPTPPVKEKSSAFSIVQTILERIPDVCRHDFVAAATVARFCMSTSPSEDGDLCSRVLQLVATSDELSKEFHQYRSALDPSVRALSMQRLWQHDASRGIAVRDFKTFAVNCIQTLLESAYLSLEEKEALELTAELWSKSVGVGV